MLIITRAANVCIKIIPFIKKKKKKKKKKDVFSSTRKYMEMVGVSMRIFDLWK